VATSGTVSTTVFTTRQVLDRSFGRCKIPPERISAEWIKIAQDNLYLALSSLVNKGIPLWAQEKIILPFYQGQALVELPLGTNDLSSANLRTLTRNTGTDTSSAGGTAANATDNDFDTVCTQTSADGNFQTEFTTGQLITTVGILPGASATWNLTFERSDDGATWTEIRAIGSRAYVDNEWAWFDLDGNLTADYIRVRETGGGTLSLREVYWGNNPNEIPLARINQDNYVNLPNKTFEGQPNQYWLDRRRGGSDSLPVMYTWPVCNLTYRYAQVVAWRQRYIQDVGTLTQELELPQRWYEWSVAELAAKIAEEHPDVQPDREQLLRQRASSAWLEAQLEERDDSPVMIQPQVYVYTR
jgi:hypothetical protein